jgi:hypothetical protein
MATNQGKGGTIELIVRRAITDSNATRARRRAAQDAERAEALTTLAAAQRKVEAVERERDAALLAAQAAGARSPELGRVLGTTSRHTIYRRLDAAQERVAA